jgi:quinol monooxygenase YgiN
MIVVINDDRVKDVEAYLPIAKAFAADAVANDEGCISMEVLVDPEIPGRVLYLSHFESREAFQKHAGGATFQKWLPELGKYFISAADSFFELKASAGTDLM